MAQRRQIRVSRSLEGEGERPAKWYGVTPSRRAATGKAKIGWRPMVYLKSVAIVRERFEDLRGV
jgi:hypothetical protein